MNDLIDGFGRKHTYLRISVTDRCNLRCLYCMPEEGIHWKERDEVLSFEEITRLAQIFIRLGVRRIRLTGGEPTVRHGIEELIEKLARLPYLESLAMTTNGVLLKKMASTLKRKGLSSLNISLDTLKKDRFNLITRRDCFNEVMEGIEKALEVGFSPLKINVVLIRGLNADELLDFVNFAKDKPLNIRFIEFMPFKSNQWSEESLVSYAEMRSLIQEHYTLIPLMGSPSAVAKDFAIEGYPGRVSFITSMTNHFCSSCNRIRLTAEGAVKPCLHDASEINLRNALRNGASDEDLAQMICRSLLLKKEAHAPLEELHTLENRSMIEIGG